MFLRLFTKPLKTFQKIANVTSNNFFVTTSFINNKISLNFPEKTLCNLPKFGFKFIGIPKRKGTHSHKHKTKKNSWKKRGRINIKYLHRVSNHNGLLKRVKIVSNLKTI